MLYYLTHDQDLAFRCQRTRRRTRRSGTQPSRLTILRYLGWTIVLFVLAVGMLTIGAFLNGLITG